MYAWCVFLVQMLKVKFWNGFSRIRQFLVQSEISYYETVMLVNLINLFSNQTIFACVQSQMKKKKRKEINQHM